MLVQMSAQHSEFDSENCSEFHWDSLLAHWLAFALVRMKNATPDILYIKSSKSRSYDSHQISTEFIHITT